MQNAGQYVPGAVNAQPTQQFVPSEPSPTGGSTISSLRQFRKRDVDKAQLEQPPKQESHVARVAPHNHYPPVSNDLYRYTSHQFSDYSPQVKYSDIADPSQPNPISTSVIQKPKSKDYMEMCNVQQQHINNQQQYSPDNGQYMHPTQGYPSGYKPEAHYIPKDQHQYQQLPHHTGQPKFNPMMAQNMRKYNPGPADNPFLNKLSKIHPSMARSIISDHHLQDPQPSYSPIDQRGIYGQQNHRYYSSSLHQPNPYAPNPNYPMNPPHHYPNYSPSCSYSRPPTLPSRYSHIERSISPTRRGYPENMHMNLPYNMPQKMPTAHNYSTQYTGGPEYAQHYQHRRMAQECYPQSCRPTQYMQGHHQIPAQEMQEHPESRISPSDSLKKFIENWAADEEPSSETNPMETNMNLRDNVKVRDDAPPGTVYMINATDVQYFENNGIPIVTSDNGGIQLTSENYQYLLKNGLVDNTGMVRIIEANKEISIDSSGNHERIVNLQIMETSKPDCMMGNKPLRPSDGINGMLPKTDNDNRRVVIHQNTIISPGNGTVSEKTSSQQPQSQAPLSDAVAESISISKELVDKNCSPINLDQLEHNIGFSEPDQPETEDIKSSSVSNLDSNVSDKTNDVSNLKSDEVIFSEDLSQKSDDNQNKSPGSKSMPIIDLFGEAHMEENQTSGAQEHNDQTDPDIVTNKDKNDISTTGENNLDTFNVKTESFVNSDTNSRPGGEDVGEKETVGTGEIESENNNQPQETVPLDFAQSDQCKTNASESIFLINSVIVSPEPVKKDGALKEDAEYADDSKHLNEEQGSCPTVKTEEYKLTTVTESLESNKPVLEMPPVHLKDKQMDLTVENVDTENKSKVLDKTNALNEYPSPTIERRKRIFSVDDIIHHIGNNIKRGSKEFDSFCSTETLTTFIEREVEFSSMEQILNVYIKKSDSVIVENYKTLATDSENLDKTINYNEPVNEKVENKGCCADLASMQENIKDVEKTVVESEERLEVDDTEADRADKSSNTELDRNQHEINTEKIQNETIDEEIESTEDEQISSDTSTVPLVLDERSNTPSIFQYRNAIRIEESSVLLQIAGELMEISVNMVNGKKVITVVPLSETTVVDYNDNYEMSATVQDIEDVQMGNSTDPEKVVNFAEIAENECEDIQSRSPVVEGITLSETQHESSSITVEGIPDNQCKKQEEDQDDRETRNSFDLSENNVNQDSTTDSKLNEAESLQEYSDERVQETCDTIASEENKQECRLEVLEDKTYGTAEVLEISTSSEDEVKVNFMELSPETIKSEDNTIPIILESSEPNIISHTISEDADKTNNFVNNETVKSLDDFNIIETIETPELSDSAPVYKTVLLSESKETPVIEKTEDAEETANDSSQVLIDGLTTNDVGQAEEGQRDNDVVEDSSTKADIYDSIEFDAQVVETENSLSEEPKVTELYDNYTDNGITNDENGDDADAEHLDYQLEDDVFISDEPSHEIIVSDPLEGVGLIEEVDKTSDNFDIPLEPVTASDEVVETSEIILAEKLENDTTQTVTIDDLDENSVKELDIEGQDKIKSGVTEDNADLLAEDLGKTLNQQPLPDVSNITENPRGKSEQPSIKLSKAEVLILSPTSTNTEDHVSICKDNVYLEPKRRSNTDVDLETNSIAITTKAAKKLYECDLQIPAVTTSGDISTCANKKSVRYQHDTVSSSKKERVVKELSRSKKFTLKRSKRINEKNQIKNEQKEMLRLLAEKRKQRKEAKQEAMRQKGFEKNTPLQDMSEKLIKIKETKEEKHKHPTENDDEYVDFKELLRARKLRKLKKMQEIKRTEARDIKKETNKNGKDEKSVSHKKDVTKSVEVSSSHAQENNVEVKTKCIGCNKVLRTADKDEKQKSKRRKSSSDASKLINSSKTITNSEADDLKLNKITASPVDLVNVAAAKIHAHEDSDKSNVTTRLPDDVKPTEIPKATASTDAKTEDNVRIPSPVPSLEVLTKKEYTSKKIKPKKRVSFCDDISSSTSNNEIYGVPAIGKIASTKTRTNHCLNPKDPRRRSKSYAGQVMVPSVSELMEENCGGVYKRKISLADYVSRKRKTSTENNCKTSSEEIECPVKKANFDSNVHGQEEHLEKLPSSYEDGDKSSKKTIKDIKTSFVIHSSDWEDSQSPIPTTVQSNEECLIQDFSGLIKSKSKKPVIDVNELISVENLENSKDKKLQEYKDKVDSQLSSLNIQIPKIKSQNLENKRHNPYGPPESSNLIKKFLCSEKITQSEMEKIKKIISYKRLIQQQKNCRSPSKSPASTSTYSQSSAFSSYEPTGFRGRTPSTSGSACSRSPSDPSYEVKNHIRPELDSKEMRLHLKKVNAKRKLQMDCDDESSSSVHSNQSESRNKKNVDYSVINRLGKDGLPKIIFKRNRQSHEDNQLVVELERIDNILEKVEEKYNVTVTQMM